MKITRKRVGPDDAKLIFTAGTSEQIVAWHGRLLDFDFCRQEKRGDSLLLVPKKKTK
jgi:hypothetical protein